MIETNNLFENITSFLRERKRELDNPIAYELERQARIKQENKKSYDFLFEDKPLNLDFHNNPVWSNTDDLEYQEWLDSNNQ